MTLSANPGISTNGWLRFFVAMAASSNLRCLSVDYNCIGDVGASCLAVALASNRTLQTLDLEATGITDFGGKVICGDIHLLSINRGGSRILQLGEGVKVHLRCAVGALHSCILVGS